MSVLWIDLQTKILLNHATFPPPPSCEQTVSQVQCISTPSGNSTGKDSSSIELFNRISFHPVEIFVLKLYNPCPPPS